TSRCRQRSATYRPVVFSLPTNRRRPKCAASCSVSQAASTFRSDPVTKRVPQWEGLDVDRIYITPKARLLNSEQFRYAMIHELAHFVSDTKHIPAIDDFAYFHRQ